MTSQRQLEVTLNRSVEAADLDFKSTLDRYKAGDWLEIIKDIVAFANSGGGTILIGVNDEGIPTGTDVSDMLSMDPADLTNQIHKYTGIHFHAFEVLKCQKEGCEICAIAIYECSVPMVFTRPGTYEVTPGKQKTAFAVGTVYFRHGAKSEPGTSDDLRAFLQRELEATKQWWLDGIAKVVESPAGSKIAITLPGADLSKSSYVPSVRLTDDPKAPAYYAVPIDLTHPYRQKEVVHEVNIRLADRKIITSHNILCIRRAFGTDKDSVFCYTQNYASPRYSQAFVDWIIEKYEEDSGFFEVTKASYDSTRTAKTNGIDAISEPG